MSELAPDRERMPPLECVPNFSEGRRTEVVDAIVGAIARVSGAEVLDRSMDPEHHRAVITLVGDAEPLVLAMLSAAGVAAKLIDLSHHSGVHPRIGALDVCPFVPLGATPMQLAIDTARRFATALADQLRIPAFLYGEACERRERANLADIRRPGFEDLRELVRHDRAWAPDRGPRVVHPTAGATAVGARFFLIAFNVELESGDLRLARAIARRVRERDGGLPAVKALGLPLHDRGVVQVSMNLVDYRVTGVRAAYDAVAVLAREHGVSVRRSELVGLVPREALDEETASYVGLADFEPRRCWLEARIRSAGS